MRVEEVALPGIGHKYTIYTKSGDQLVIVVHQSGKRELHYYEAGQDYEPAASLDLTDEEARELGAILAGVLFHPEATGDLNARLQEQTIEWLKLEPGSPCIGRQIKELQVKDAHILAVLREGEALIPNPDPELHLQVADILVVAGPRYAVDEFKHRFRC